jgi:carbon-monoxide dehydrogenase large subunit
LWRWTRSLRQRKAPCRYRIPTAHISARAVLSTTMCTTPYRSAGRPEVIYVIERLIDKAA